MKMARALENLALTMFSHLKKNLGARQIDNSSKSITIDQLSDFGS